MNYQLSGRFYFTLEENEIYAVAKNYESSIRTDKHFINRLKELNYKGNINIDMLLKNGNTSKRYLSIEFDGNRFLKNTMKVNTKINIIEKVNINFYRQNFNLIENSILSRDEVFTIKNSYFN